MIKLFPALAAISLSLVASAAHAEVFTIKGKAISSNSDLKANSVAIKGIGASGTRELSKSDSSVNAIGYGADFDFTIAEYGHLGAGVAYVDYANDNEQISYKDLAPEVYGAVDFVKERMFSLYAKAGVSYHKIDLKDTKLGPVTVAYDPLDIWNFDAGLGVQTFLSKDVTLGLEYSYSGSFKSEKVDINYSGFGLTATPETLQDIKLQKNELTAIVGVMF